MEASQSIENTQLVAGQRAPILAALSAIAEQKTDSRPNGLRRRATFRGWASSPFSSPLHGFGGAVSRSYDLGPGLNQSFAGATSASASGGPQAPGSYS